MNISLPENFDINFRDFFRKRGYSPLVGIDGKESYVRRLTAGHYPRFHIYINEKPGQKNFLSLHLDQKKASYPGYSDHSAEYESEIVIKEAEIINEALKEFLNQKIKEFNEKENKKSIFSLFKKK